MAATASPPNRRRVTGWLTVSALAATSLPPSSWAQSSPGQGEASYEPKRGQSGKDVVWIATPDPVVRRLLQLAGVTANDTVVDLGSGDGNVVIAAARDFHARALGIEFNPDLVAHAAREAARAGVADRARFVRGDIFETDFSSATVVTMYLLPHLNVRLRPLLFRMKPGTRIVSHEFDMDDWEPDEVSRAGTRAAHLWIVPANTGGRWRTRLARSSGSTEVQLTLEQTFQKLRGEASFDGVRTTLRMPRLAGDQIAFAFTDGDGIVRHVQATVRAAEMTGTVSLPSGARAPFNAQREGVAPPIGGSAPVDPQRLDALQGALQR